MFDLVGRRNVVVKEAWSDDASRLVEYVLEFWVEQRRPPNLLDIHAATDLSFREVRRAYRELDAGAAASVADDRLQLNLAKAPPFSSVPTPVACYDDDGFLSYLGCAAEATTVGRLPWLEDRRLTVRSYCGCCYEPIVLEVEGQRNVAVGDRPQPVIALMGSPWDWEGGVSSARVCDDYHYALDREHGERLGHLYGRRVTFIELEQMSELSRDLAEQRARDPLWGPRRTIGSPAVAKFASVGIDVAHWR